jgi:hypothetical protein
MQLQAAPAPDASCRNSVCVSDRRPSGSRASPARAASRGLPFRRGRAPGGASTRPACPLPCPGARVALERARRVASPVTPGAPWSTPARAAGWLLASCRAGRPGTARGPEQWLWWRAEWLRRRGLPPSLDGAHQARHRFLGNCDGPDPRPQLLPKANRPARGTILREQRDDLPLDDPSLPHCSAESSRGPEPGRRGWERTIRPGGGARVLRVQLGL